MTEEMSVRLKDYLEALLHERIQRIDAVLTEREKALTVTAQGLERRLDHLNALREENIRREQIFVSKGMYFQAHEDIRKRLESMEKFQAKLIGMGVTLALFSGVLGALVSRLWLN